jgi:hypothetical protein
MLDAGLLDVSNSALQPEQGGPPAGLCSELAIGACGGASLTMGEQKATRDYRSLSSAMGTAGGALLDAFAVVRRKCSY